MGSSQARRKRRSAKSFVPTSATAATPKQRAVVFGVFALLVGGIVLAIVLADPTADPERVWSPEHRHWHDKNGNEIK